MAVQIVPVTSSKDIRKFVQFANDLYKDCPQYCPPLFNDELATFDTKKNPVFEVAECQLFLAYKENRIAGRIAALINHNANKHWDVKKVRFGWMDFIDDLEVSKALLDAAAEWGRKKGMTLLNGPVGFTDLDHEGLLIEGYEYLAPLASLYNYPYYVRHMEAYGLTKENDWIELQLQGPFQMPERLERISKVVLERSRLHIENIRNTKQLLAKYGYTFFDLIDECYSRLYNYSPLTQKQKEYYSKYYFDILNFDFVTIVANEKDEIVGLGVCMPDISKEMRKCGGKLWPFGWYHLLKALKAKRFEHIDMLIIAVRPDYQGKGVNSVIITEQFPSFIKYGVQCVETTSIMETNWKNLANWEIFNHKQHKRRRAYVKEIGNTRS